MLRVRALHKGFATPSGKLPVLRGVQCDVDRGEFVAIVGESGCGKSTLLQVLGTLEPPDRGEAELDGISLFSLSAQAQAAFRNRKLGFVYQAHHLIPALTALENVMLPLQIRGEENHATIRRKAESLLEELGLAERGDHIPGKLSGGEAQRVAVARALIGDPLLLLADEPTGNLDEQSATTVFELLQTLCRRRKTAVIMVTHSHALAQAADRVLRLQHGLLVPPDGAS